MMYHIVVPQAWYRVSLEPFMAVQVNALLAAAALVLGLLFAQVGV